MADETETNLDFIPDDFRGEDGAPDLAAFKEHYEGLKQGPDMSFVPEDFRKDGKVDAGAFTEHYQALVSESAQAKERAEAAPKEAKDYPWALPDGFEAPEGLPEGTDLSKIVSEDDPDLPGLREIMLKHGAPKEMATDLAGLLAQRELRSVAEGAKARDDEMKKLGPNSQERTQTVERRLKAALPEGEAKALIDGIGSADALKGVEALLRRSGVTTEAGSGGIDNRTASIDERIAAGLSQRRAG